MPAKKTLLFLSHSADLFGAEKSLLDLILGLDQQKYHIVVLLPCTGPLHDVLNNKGIKTKIIPYKNWVAADCYLLLPYRTIKNILTFFVYKQQIRQLRPDLIYSNTSVFPFGGILAKWLKTPHIWHLREFVEKDIGAKFYYGRKRSLNFINNASDKVICNSDALKGEVSDLVSKDKLATIYNGILDRQDNTICRPKAGISSKQSYSICMVGSIAPHKGHTEALKALLLLTKESNLNITFRIVGSGPSKIENTLKKLTSELGLDKIVRWEGYLNNVTEIYREADATLVCSRYEPFGRVAVESMAAGTPVVGTNAGGLPEIIVDGKTGVLYPAGNHEILAEKLRQLLCDDELYANISQDGLKSVYERFTRERYLEEIQNLLDSLLVKE